MGEQDSQGHAASARATELIADFHARHEAWRRQGENLERLRSDARAAAALEAAAILTSARGDIRRIIGDARRALLALTEQLRAITEQSGNQPAAEGTDDVPYSVLQARRDLARLLTDMRPDLDELTAQTQQFAEPAAAQPMPPAPEVEQPVVVPAVEVDDVAHDVAHDAALAAIAPLFQQKLDADGSLKQPPDSMEDLVKALPDAPASAPSTAPATAPATVPAPARFASRTMLTVLAIVGLGVVGGGGWWVSDAFTSDDLSRTLASIPPARRDKPAWLEDRVPTINATLVGLPAAAPAAEPSNSGTAPASAAPAATAGSSPDASR